MCTEPPCVQVCLQSSGIETIHSNPAAKNQIKSSVWVDPFPSRPYHPTIEHLLRGLSFFPAVHVARVQLNENTDPLTEETDFLHLWVSF